MRYVFALIGLLCFSLNLLSQETLPVSGNSDKQFKVTITYGWYYPYTADMDREVNRDENDFRILLPEGKKWDENYSDKKFRPVGIDGYVKFKLKNFNLPFLIGLGYSYDEIILANFDYSWSGPGSLPMDLTYSTLDTFDKFEAKLKFEFFKFKDFTMLAGPVLSINYNKHFTKSITKEYATPSTYDTYTKTIYNQESKGIAPGYSLEADAELMLPICGSQIIFGAGVRYDWVRITRKGTLTTTVIQPSGTYTQTSSSTQSRIKLDGRSVLLYIGTAF